MASYLIDVNLPYYFSPWHGKEYLQAANAELLLDWGARLLTAHELRDVFGD